MSGMKARQFFADLYGIDIDHHEYAYVLDAMYQRGECEYYASNGGNTEYIINVGGPK
jgi:hypothetical protein